MWLSPEILKWQITLGTHEQRDRRSGARSYEIWSHAEDLFNQHSKDSRISGISTLWRAINHRLRLIERIYSLKKIPIRDKPSDYLHLLEFLELVRPLMLQKLKDVRNAVEHEDESPPDFESCQVLLEFTWYFLRSTDGLTQSIITHLQLDAEPSPTGEDSPYWFDIHNHPHQNWIPRISGWITPDLFSNEPRSDWLIIKVDKVETRAELIYQLKDSENEESIKDSGRGRNPEDIYLSGEVRGGSEPLKNLIKVFLGLT